MFIGMPYVSRFQFEIKIPFVSCSSLSKKFRKIFAKNFGTLRGVAGPHSFKVKLNFGIFSILCLYGVAYDLEILFKTFQTYSVNLRGVTGPYPFSENVENVCIIPILVSNKL